MNRFTYKIVHTAAKLNPGHYVLAKAEGMFRLFMGERACSELDPMEPKAAKKPTLMTP